MARQSTYLPTRAVILLGMALACSPLLAQQQTVYQWKDANGVTHYADSAPAQTYKKRDISSRSGTAVETAEVKKSSGNTPCDNARSNLAQLRGEGPVAIDNDGDGKADANLTPEQRANHIALNEAMVKASCTSQGAAAANSN